jgi:hypothetical protein
VTSACSTTGRGSVARTTPGGVVTGAGS